MTTRYRVEYALKTHRRDHFIEWIKGLLAVPFVLHSQPTGVFESRKGGVAKMAEESNRRYVEIMKDIEDMIDDHIEHQNVGLQGQSKLKLLVPSIGTFFTRLPLANAFEYQDSRRCISFRRFVPPSFNDVRLILNTAQMMAITAAGPLDLATFDGDVTLYDNGKCLEPESEVISKIIHLMSRNTKIGIVTAAGYLESEKYYERLHGLLEAVQASTLLTTEQKHNLVVMGGEANYLFKFSARDPYLLEWVPRESWILEEMRTWTGPIIAALLDRAESALQECIQALQLPASIIRKPRAVGIVPNCAHIQLPRESLEETVLVVEKILDMLPGTKLPFCAFNGGNDVFVDVGDKSWGVLACQKIFGNIEGRNTIHVGDQFLSASGANDFRARRVGTTAWVASPRETVSLLGEIMEFMDVNQEK